MRKMTYFALFSLIILDFSSILSRNLFRKSPKYLLAALNQSTPLAEFRSHMKICRTKSSKALFTGFRDRRNKHFNSSRKSRLALFYIYYMIYLSISNKINNANKGISNKINNKNK